MSVKPGIIAHKTLYVQPVIVGAACQQEWWVQIRSDREFEPQRDDPNTSSIKFIKIQYVFDIISHLTFDLLHSINICVLIFIFLYRLFVAKTTSLPCTTRHRSSRRRVGSAQRHGTRHSATWPVSISSVSMGFCVYGYVKHLGTK